MNFTSFRRSWILNFGPVATFTFLKSLHSPYLYLHFLAFFYKLRYFPHLEQHRGMVETFIPFQMFFFFKYIINGLPVTPAPSLLNFFSHFHLDIYFLTVTLEFYPELKMTRLAKSRDRLMILLMFQHVLLDTFFLILPNTVTLML